MKGHSHDKPMRAAAQVMLEIAIDADPEWDSSTRWEELVRNAAEAAIAESAFPQLAQVSRPLELSVRLAGNDEVRALNSSWRGKDKPTNVLSFPQLDRQALTSIDEAGPELMLGDLILAHGICSSEAAEKQVRLADHAAHLVVHGTLHLLGYDHQDDVSADEMEAREIRALGRLGIDDPYLAEEI